MSQSERQPSQDHSTEKNETVGHLLAKILVEKNQSESNKDSKDNKEDS